jgi:mono/diheme cytochrome c family protein
MHLSRKFMLKPLSPLALLIGTCLALHPASAQDASHAETGEHLFKQNCAACHSVAPGEKLVGPSLHAELKGHPPKKTPAQVTTIIQNGNGTMPAFKALLAPKDIEDLIAYLKTK